MPTFKKHNIRKPTSRLPTSPKLQAALGKPHPCSAVAALREPGNGWPLCRTQALQASRALSPRNWGWPWGPDCIFWPCFCFAYSQVRKTVSLSKRGEGTSLVVEWLGLPAPKARGLGSVPGQGTRSHMLHVKIPSAIAKTWYSQRNKYSFLKSGEIRDRLREPHVSRRRAGSLFLGWNEPACLAYLCSVHSPQWHMGFWDLVWPHSTPLDPP